MGANMADYLVFAAIILGGLLVRFVTGRSAPVRYRRKPVLTGGEREFFFRLRQALPECVVCPQVAVSALLEPAGVGRLRQAAVDCIDGKRVGYAVFDRNMELVAVVELDHRTRTSRRAAARDAYFSSAGIRTIRFQSKRLPSETKIRSAVFVRESATAHDAKGVRNGEIEFVKPATPWRNTVNAHI